MKALMSSLMILMTAAATAAEVELKAVNTYLGDAGLFTKDEYASFQLSRTAQTPQITVVSMHASRRITGSYCKEWNDGIPSCDELGCTPNTSCSEWGVIDEVMNHGLMIALDFRKAAALAPGEVEHITIQARPAGTNRTMKAKGFVYGRDYKIDGKNVFFSDRKELAELPYEYPSGSSHSQYLLKFEARK